MGYNYRANDLILDHGAGGSWDAVACIPMCQPIKVDDLIYQYYSGVDGVGSVQVGLAVSGKDNFGLTKSPNNPIIPLGSPGDIDETGASPIAAIYISSRTHPFTKTIVNTGKWYVFYVATDGLGDNVIAWASGRNPDSLTKQGTIVSPPVGYSFVTTIPASIEYREYAGFWKKDWEQEKSQDPVFVLRYALLKAADATYAIYEAQLKLW
jgi:hypothetical protein